MTEALYALLTRLIDYAGLFPPAALNMNMAVRNYRSYVAGPHEWALGRFVVPAAKLDEVDPFFSCTVIGMPPRTVHSCEIKVERATDVPEARAMIVYYELPVTEDPSPLARGRGRAKVRTGGLTPDAVPSSVALARFMARCAAARVPFKATAGLHHPLRSAEMHGFINVFLGAAHLWHGGSEADTVATLEQRSPHAFAWDDASVAWHGHRLTVDQLRTAREQFAISFGSCSFDEPIHDLQQLGWL